MKNVSILGVAFVIFSFLAEVRAQDNRTFYERTDGGVTVVQPTTNMFGSNTQAVRTYSSTEEAYSSEYPLESALVSFPP